MLLCTGRMGGVAWRRVIPPTIWTVPELAAALKEKGQPVLILGEVLPEVQAELAMVLKEQAAFGRGARTLWMVFMWPAWGCPTGWRPERTS